MNEIKNNDINKFKEILNELPKKNFEILKRWIKLFDKICSSSLTLMKPFTLSTVFASNFWKFDDSNDIITYTTPMNEICSYFIENFYFLFDFQITANDLELQISNLKNELDNINFFYSDLLNDYNTKINNLLEIDLNFDNYFYSNIIDTKKSKILVLNQKIQKINYLIDNDDDIFKNIFN
jgi:hypothetical protein